MDFTTLLKLLPAVVSVATTLSNLFTSTASNDSLAVAIKALLPASVYNIIAKYGEVFFDGVRSAVQVVAAVQTVYNPDMNRTIQGVLNVVSPMLGLPDPKLALDGFYGPLTKDAAMAVQRKLGGDVVADGWIGRLSMAALQTFMNAHVVVSTPTMATISPPDVKTN